MLPDLPALTLGRSASRDEFLPHRFGFVRKIRAKVKRRA